MNASRPSPTALVALVGILGGLGLHGCSPEQKYRVLTFFFDGVPPLGAALSGLEAAAGTPSGRRATGRRSPLPRQRVYTNLAHKKLSCSECHHLGQGMGLKQELATLCATCHRETFRDRAFVHGPTNVAQCGACHSPHNSKYPVATLAPQPALCTACHDAPDLMAPAYHAGFQDLACSQCHDPHGADNRFFLRKDRPTATQPTTQPVNDR